MQDVRRAHGVTAPLNDWSTRDGICAGCAQALVEMPPEVKQELAKGPPPEPPDDRD